MNHAREAYQLQEKFRKLSEFRKLSSLAAVIFVVINVMQQRDVNTQLIGTLELRIFKKNQQKQSQTTLCDITTIVKALAVP